MDRPGKVAYPTRGQLNRENKYFPVPVFAPKNYWVSRDRLGRSVPRQPAHSPNSVNINRLNLVPY